MIAGSRPTLDQRAQALALLEELDRAATALGGGEAPEQSPLEKERESRVAAEASARQTAFVYETTSSLFASPLDAESRVQKLAALVVPDLADWCICDLVRENDVKRVAVSSWNDMHAELAGSMRREYRLAASSLGAIATVLATGKPHVVAVRSAEEHGHDELETFLDTIGAKSWVTVPLAIAGRVLGAMTFVFAESHRFFDESTVALTADLAQRAALAVDNAVLVEKLEKAVRARDDMVGVVSHDLRNPLASIKMAATLLSEEAKTQGKEERKIGMILRATDRVEALLRDLLDVTSLEAGRVTLERQTRTVPSVLADALELIAPIAANANVRVDVRDLAPHASVHCDPVRLTQIFWNLLRNAVKFTPKGGSLVIAAEEAGAMCVFSVADTGQGIPPDQLPHIFDRFWQGRSKAREGAGLGLAIAKGLVEAHGGIIDVTSVLGEGTTFRFTIPRV